MIMIIDACSLGGGGRDGITLRGSLFWRPLIPAALGLMFGSILGLCLELHFGFSCGSEVNLEIDSISDAFRTALELAW